LYAARAGEGRIERRWMLVVHMDATAARVGLPYSTSAFGTPHPSSSSKWPCTMIRSPIGSPLWCVVRSCSPSRTTAILASDLDRRNLRPWSGARLSLALRIPNTEDIARACAGWECHFEMLAAAMEGVPVKFPFQRFKTARDAYRTLAS
jgi:hypothetical protein